MFLNEYEAEIKKICDENQIYCLSNFDKVKFDDKNALEFLSKISKTRGTLNNDGKFDMLLGDLINSISPAIKFSIANMFLYLKFANNYERETVDINGLPVTTYFKTIGDARYFYYLNASFEKLYNYWDRIGDILEFSFNLRLNQHQIYYGVVIDRLSAQNIRSDNLSWLKTFKEVDYSKYLNRIRKLVVHERQKDTYFFYEWLSSISSGNHRGRMRELQMEKESYPGILKEQLNIANQGFEKMVYLISEKGPFEI